MALLLEAEHCDVAHARPLVRALQPAARAGDPRALVGVVAARVGLDNTRFGLLTSVSGERCCPAWAASRCANACPLASTLQMHRKRNVSFAAARCTRRCRAA